MVVQVIENTYVDEKILGKLLDGLFGKGKYSIVVSFVCKSVVGSLLFGVKLFTI